ncbi:hypothetical protein [Aliivibrio wodanis]|uniref:hypothetical protein n=1 Tax=Aliivibrio wodanis TaxID=80852 RepID=UPI00406C368C
MKRLIVYLHGKILKISYFACFFIFFGYNAIALADTYEFNPNTHYCMADAYLLKDGNSLPQDRLNCTANDVEITQVVPLDQSAECILGETFSFDADITVRTNANRRYDTTFYLPLTSLSPQVVQNTENSCSLLLPIPGGSGQNADVELDGDVCGDITKSQGSDQYVLAGESITMYCIDDDNDGRADFNYCAAWDNIERNNCSVDPDPYSGQIPNTKSKCNCDTFNIDVFIRPGPPVISKILVPNSPSQHNEPGGEFTYNLSIYNPSTTSSLFIHQLVDVIDISGDGIVDTTLDLWDFNNNTNPDIQITNSTCIPGNPVEIPASGTYSCVFTVAILDSDLPDDQSDEIYNDVIKAVVLDKTDQGIGDGSTCPVMVSPTIGDNCSQPVQVTIANLPPTILVEKTANPTSVMEPGGWVEYTLTVTNTSGNHDAMLNILSLVDNINGSDFTLDQVGDCVTNSSFDNQVPYSCSFSRFILGDAFTFDEDTITVVAEDNEGDIVESSDNAVVAITNVKSNITLVKTADPTSVDETGDDPTLYRDVNYFFAITIDSSGVDTVTLKTLIDSSFNDITNDCLVIELNQVVQDPPLALMNMILDPGDSIICQYQGSIQGNAGDIHENLATINGIDDDGEEVTASDNALVTFINIEPSIELDLALSFLAVIEITNTSIENITFSSLTILGEEVSSNPSGPMYAVYNIGGLYDGVSYDACNLANLTLEYFGSNNNTMACAFVVELKPGLGEIQATTFQSNLDDVIKTYFVDDEGNSVQSSVDISVSTSK